MHRHDVPVDPMEAQEVVRLAAERQSAAPDNGPTVNGLAEALGLAPVEIERLLAEVRAQRGIAVERRRIFGDRSAALSAALALALFLITAAFGLVYVNMRSASPPAEVASTLPGLAPAPEEHGDLVMPPIEAPGVPVIPDSSIIIRSETDLKREEIERIAEEIAQIHARRSMADAERSVENLDRTLNRLRRELEALKKDKASD